MTDARVRAALEQVEAWLGDPAWEPDPEALEGWRLEFEKALGLAEKGEGWAELAQRAHAAGKDLETRAMRLAKDQALVKAELEAQARGARALRGYGAGIR